MIPKRTIHFAIDQIVAQALRSIHAKRLDPVARKAVATHGFKSFRAYVAKVGRAQQIELYFIVPADAPARPIAEWDAMRDAIGNAIGPDSPDRWLTIIFTSDMEWAE